MPFDGKVLLTSDAWIEASEAGRAAIMHLWWEAWEQVPAGSLPDNDHRLARMANYGICVDVWLSVRDQALRGWELCTDGRWYHPVLAEWAQALWGNVQAQKDRRAKDAERKRSERAAAKAKRTNGPGPSDGGGSSGGRKGSVQRTGSPCPSDARPKSGGRAKDIGTSSGASDSAKCLQDSPTASSGRKGRVQRTSAPRPLDTDAKSERWAVDVGRTSEACAMDKADNSDNPPLSADNVPASRGRTPAVQRTPANRPEDATGIGRLPPTPHRGVGVGGTGGATAPPARDGPDSGQVDAIIAAFDARLEALWGTRRLQPHPHDRPMAEQWLSSGLSVATCVEIIDRQCRQMHRRGLVKKPYSLRVFATDMPVPGKKRRGGRQSRSARPPDQDQGTLAMAIPGAELPVWQSAVSKQLDETQFQGWIKPLKLVGVAGNEVVIKAPTPVHANWVRQHYESVLVTVFSAMNSAVRAVRLEIADPKTGGRSRRPGNESGLTSLAG